MKKKILFFGIFIALFLIHSSQQSFSQYGFNCGNPIPTVDNSRPVRLYIYFLETEANKFKENNDPASGETIRNKILNQVEYLNTAIFNSKLDIDNDPQRFEIARIFNIPDVINSGILLYHQQYLYNSDLYIRINNDNSTSSTTVPQCPYNGCPPLDETLELVTYWPYFNNFRYNLVHEVGHALGCEHDALYEGNDRSSQDPPVCYHHGYYFSYGTVQDQGVTKDCIYGTIMSYRGVIVDDESTQYKAGRIPFFSNPNSEWEGNSLGTINATCPIKREYNAKAIFDTKNQIRNLCSSYDDLNLRTIDPNISSNEIMAWEIADAFAIQTIMSDGDYIINANAIVQFRAGDRIHIKSGFHAKSGCKFKAFINDGTSRGFYGN